MKCTVPEPAKVVSLFFITLAGIFGLVATVYYLNHRWMVAVQCQSWAINVTQETCYVGAYMWNVVAYPYTGRVRFCYPVFYWFFNRSSTFCHWKDLGCGLTRRGLLSDLSEQYPVGNYTPCWYYNDSCVGDCGTLSYFPIYLREMYTDSGTLFILACVCAGIALFVPLLLAFYGCIKHCLQRRGYSAIN
jgi:hypothetical protein